MRNLTQLFIILAGSLAIVGIALVLGAVNSTAAVAFLGVIMGTIASVAGSIVVARLSHREQMRRAVAEQRFQAHQEAYRHWAAIRPTVHRPDDRTKAIREASDWWHERCLYLDPEAREAFWRFLYTADLYELKVEETRVQTRGTEAYEKAREEQLEAWAEIQGLGKVLEKCVALPPLAYDAEPPPSGDD